MARPMTRETVNRIMNQPPAASSESTILLSSARTASAETREWAPASQSDAAFAAAPSIFESSATAADKSPLRAAVSARSGDLSAAVDELSKMDGAAANAASDWLAGAHSRISADAVRAELNKIVLSGFAAGG